MVQRTIVRLTDDVSGVEIAAGKGETVIFSLDGRSYEIDLPAKNASDLRKALRRGRSPDQELASTPDPDQGRCRHPHRKGVGTGQRLPGPRPRANPQGRHRRIRRRQLSRPPIPASPDP